MIISSESTFHDNTDTDDLYQIALLIDQLKHDETALRINAANSLTQIARSLGPDRTRSELIPFLTDSVDDEDEVIAVIAEKLGDLCPYVGGNEYAFMLLAPLEYLVCGEDSTVRDKALVSVETVVSKLTEDQVTRLFIPFLNRLANKDWFTSRAAAASLIHLTFVKVSDKLRTDLIQLFLRLCGDETPTVRKSAAQNLVQLFKVAQSGDFSHQLTLLLEAFQNFSKDEQDSIRNQVIVMCKLIPQASKQDIKLSHILPVVTAISSDRSWRLRWALANRLHEIVEVFSENTNKTSSAYTSSIVALSGVFDTLLNDSEPEVRAAAATHLAAVSQSFSTQLVIDRIVPTAQRLVSDSSEFVRASFASEISLLAPFLGKENTVQLLLPILLALLRDEVSEVRLNVISGLDYINKVIGIDLLSQSLLPAIAELAQDVKWRVRLAIIEHLPMLAKHLGKDFFTMDGNGEGIHSLGELSPSSNLSGTLSLMQLSVNWLSDEVFQIRKAAADNLFRLSQQFGIAWTTAQVLPTLQKLKSQPKFSQRLTALYAVQVLLGYKTDKQSSVDGDLDFVYRSLLRVVFDLSSDVVPNVRLNAAKTLIIAANQPRLSTAICNSGVGSSSGSNGNIFSETFEVLDKLLEDSDRDVKFFAKKAMDEFDR